ncbi:MAG: hypothetical protein WCG45_05480 [bacterium]
MRTQTFIAIASFLLGISWGATGFSLLPASSPPKPDYIESGSVQFQVDLLVMKYPNKVRPNEYEIHNAARQAMKKHKSKHTIIMPDDYTPVGIPKSKFNEMKKLLGDSFFSMDNLSCDNAECLDKQ